MNAIAATGVDQASLLAVFTLPVANAAPATPLFANLIHLMMAPPSSGSNDSKAVANFQGTAATPAQIADAMIRSMLGPTALPDPAIVPNAPPLIPAATVDPVSSSATEATAAQAPTLPGNAKPSTAGAAIPNQNPPAPRKQSLNATDAVMAPVMPTTVPATMLPVASSSEPKTNVPLVIAQNAPTVPLPLAKGSPEGGIAFTAVLTPSKETLDTSGPVSAQEPAPGAGNPSTQVTITATPQSAENPAQPAAANLQTAVPETVAQAGGNSQPGGDASSQQENDSPETPARPVAAAAAKIKPDVPPDDNALQAAVAHAAVPSFTAFPADANRASVPAQSIAAAPAETPYNATAEALRTTESNLPAAPQLRTGAAQEIAIRIAPPDSPAVDLRLVERAGQVHVDVRTADAALQTNLRQDLGTLTSSLERAGYHTETFTPASTLSRAASSAQAGNQDNQQDPSQNRGGSGDSGGRRQQQQKRSGTWLEELEEQS